MEELSQSKVWKTKKDFRYFRFFSRVAQTFAHNCIYNYKMYILKSQILSGNKIFSEKMSGMQINFHWHTSSYDFLNLIDLHFQT